MYRTDYIPVTFCYILITFQITFLRKSPLEYVHRVAPEVIKGKLLL